MYMDKYCQLFLIFHFCRLPDQSKRSKTNLKCHTDINPGKHSTSLFGLKFGFNKFCLSLPSSPLPDENFGDKFHVRPQFLPACCRKMKDKQNQPLQPPWYSHSYCSPLSIHACYFYACRKFEKTKACIRHRVLHTHQEVFLAFWGIFRIPFLFLRSLLKSSIWVAGTSICSSKDSSGSSSAPNSKLINQDVI